MNSAHGPCACAARSRSNATSCSAWWHSRSIKYSASRSSGPRRPERRPLRPREHRENSPRSMNFARGSLVKDFASPTATIIASLAAVCVTTYFARLQYQLAKQQTRIAAEKLRHDLYDRRFAIIVSIFEYYQAIISWAGTEEQKAARDRFFRAYQEAGFLFKSESRIEAILKELNDDGNKVIGFKEHSDQFRPHPALYLEKFNESTDIQTKKFDDGLRQLKVALRQYLDFANL